MGFNISSCQEKTEEKPKINVSISTVPLKGIDLNSPWVDSVYNSMTDEERVQQLIWLSVDWQEYDTLPNTYLKYGGLILPENQFTLNTIYQQSLDSNYDQKAYNFLLKGFRNQLVFFNALKLTPSFEGLNHSGDSAYQHYFMDVYSEFFNYYDCSFIVSHQDSLSPWKFSKKLTNEWEKILAQKNILNIHSSNSESANKNSPINCQFNSKTQKKDNDTTTYYNILDNDTYFIDSVLLGSHSLLMYSVSAKNKNPFDSLNKFSKVSTIVSKNQNVIEQKVRKVLALKEYILQSKKHNENPLTLEQQLAVLKTKLIGVVHQSHYKGNVIHTNDGTLPILNFPKKKWSYLSISSSSLSEFTRGMKHYATITEIRKTNLNVNLQEFSTQNPFIIVLNDYNYKLDEVNDFVKKIRDLNKSTKVIVVEFTSTPTPSSPFSTLPNYLTCPSKTSTSQYFCAQALMGGIAINGQLPDTVLTTKPLETKKIRLAYTIPEEVGICADSLKKIDKIASEAIFSKATPGCQVFVAKEGKVIHNKAYGYHAYDYKTSVHTNDVYDLASVTKVAATTLCAMHLYDKGKFKLNDSIKHYLPDTLTKFLKHPSRIGNITFQELLIHKSGLPSGLPIYKFIAYINKIIGRFDRYYCDESSKLFCVEVAKDFYLDVDYLDSIWVDMNRIWPGEKVFKYSDANMNVLYQVLKPLIKGKKSYDRYLDSVFYKPLMLETMGFLPLKYLDTLAHRIAPTEFDTYWRYQVLKGHVHDPNAALYGGVAGNAGLFSSAQDLGLLFQLFLNKGSYGGKKYIESSTVELFTSHQPGSHRGLGFDKPTASSGNVVAKDAPYSSFGHSGFTGICAWGDFENELVFAFTSNRVHPSPTNKKLIEHGIRGRMHQVIYNQLYYSGSYKNKSTKNIQKSKLVVDSTQIIM